MSSSSANSRDSRLQAILLAYLQAVDAGERPDHLQIIEQHPDLRSELTEFFADAARLDQLARSLNTASYGDVLEANPPPNIATIRYFGDYELIEEIARGGMGIVYKARQESLKRLVALKMILKGELATQADVQRFRSEAEAAAKLDHPNIVPIYEVGEHQGQHYFSMKLIDSGSEREAVSRRTEVGQRRNAAILATVARAVHHAHQRGILHRDLKPGNILIDENGDPHVTDFGLAKRVEGDSGLTRSGVAVGTPSYMAPEQARAEKLLTTAVDVYSLGAVLYERLTGRPPFRGDDPLTTLLLVIDQEPPRPRALNSAIDRDLEIICLKCLEKDPARRYGSAEALAEDLERWLRGEPIQARPASTWTQSRKWVRRRPALAALLAVLLLGAPMALALISWQWRTALHQGERARSELSRAETALYINRLAGANAAWRDNEAASALRLLNDCPKELRGWEWRYLRQLCDGPLQTIPTPENGAAAWFRVAVSPDGRLAATASEDPRFPYSTPLQGEVRLWDLAAGKELPPLEEFSHWGPCAVAFSPDGTLLAVAGLRPDRLNTKVGLVKVWDVAARKLLYKAAEEDEFEAVRGLAFSPDGRFLAAGAGKVALLDAHTGRRLRTIDAGGTSLSFSPDSQSLAIAHHQIGYAQVVDVASGKIRCKLQPNPPVPPFWGFLEINYSPDGKRIATVGYHRPGEIQVWDAGSGAQLMNLGGVRQFVNNLAFSPDGQRLAAACSDGTVSLLQADSGTELFSLRVGNALGVAFSPDGMKLLSCGNERALHIWDASRGQQAREWHPGRIPLQYLALSPDGKYVGAQWSGGIKVWSALTGEELLSEADLMKGHSSRCRSVGFTHDSSRVVLGLDRAIWMWDLATRRLVQHFETEGTFSEMCVSPTADVVFTSASVSPVRAYDLKSGRRSAISDDKLWGLCALSPDGRRVAVRNGSNRHLIWEPASRNIVLLNHGETVGGWLYLSRAGFNADGNWLASLDRDKLTVCAATTGERLWQHQLATGNEVRPAVFSPDGLRLARVNARGKEIELWDVVSGQQVFALKMPTASANEEVTDLCWSADGQSLAAAGFSSLAVWSTRSSPKDWPAYARSWHLAATQDAEREKRWFAAGVHLGRLLDAAPADVSLRQRRAEAHARLGNWVAAADDLQPLTTFADQYRFALLQLASKRPDALAAVDALVKAWGDTMDAKVARRLVQVWVLTPEAARDRDRLRRLAEIVVANGNTGVTSAGLVDETKTYAQVLEQLRDAKLAQQPGVSLGWPFLAVIATELGDAFPRDAWRRLLADRCLSQKQRLAELVEIGGQLSNGDIPGWEDLLALDLLRSDLDDAHE